MTFDWIAYFWCLAAVLVFAAGVWLASVVKRDVSIVDSFWSLFFVFILVAYIILTASDGPRLILLLVLVSLWAVRLSAHISWRSWGEPEDHRYAKIRQNNEPNFTFKSLYLVFALQAFLAWIIALPLVTAVSGSAPLNIIDGIALLLWLIGMFFETTGDYQLARFKADPANKGQVMDQGLWRYTRHPNYFGECCLWWGFYLFALAAGYWWTIIAPLLMTVLLLKVSGVTMLEQNIGERRPGYRQYIERTNAFFPGLPK